MRRALDRAADGNGRGKAGEARGGEGPTLPGHLHLECCPDRFRKCAACHLPGGLAPFSLLDYADAKKRASSIAAVTQKGLMPPWLAAPGYGDFVGESERRLDKQELRTIQEWVKRGALEGKSLRPAVRPKIFPMAARPPGPHSQAVAPLHPSRAWTRRQERDAQLRHSRPGPEDAIREGARISPPGLDRKLFFHANVLYDPTGLSRLHEGQGDQPGFMSMNLEIESDRFDPEGHFPLWKPGTAPAAEIDGMPWRLRKGSDLVLNMHMIPDGKPHKIQPTVGLCFTDKPPTKHPILIELHNTQAINIPPGDKHFVVTDQVTLPLDVEVFAVYPHAHYLGKDLEGYAILPGGEKKWLLRIPGWNPEWSAVFRYVKPVFLPKGTVVHMHFVYDNSSGNPRNPSHPPKRVVGGDQATNEMAEFWLQVLPVNWQNLPVDPRLVLQETMMRHDVEMDLRDTLALFNLGAALQAEGKPEEAGKYYRQERQFRPGDAVVETALGGVLQAQGKTEEAVRHYRATLSASPKYAHAHYNLGIILLRQGEFGEAAEQFRAVLAFNPNDASSHNDLGSALASQGKWREAAIEFQSALQLNPQNADAHDNLGYILAR